MERLDLKTKSLVELKALGYDLNAGIQQYSQILNAVNQEIILRTAENGQSEAEATQTATGVSNTSELKEAKKN